MTTQLNPTDLVGMSFWIISAAMVAATFFFWVERDRAVGKWKTSLSVAAMVTGIAAIHYFYMRGVWAETGASPLVYRYVDWLLTVPLQIIEFYLILAAIAVVGAALFWRLMIASVVMLVAGYLGEIDAVNVWGAFIVGMAAWIYIIYEIWAGDAKAAANNASEGVQFAFTWMTYILTFGWAIYPIGYLYGAGTLGDNPDTDMLNIVYNIADVVNKTAFGMMVWYAATIDTAAEKSD